MLHGSLASILDNLRHTPRDRDRGRCRRARVDRPGGDPEPDHDHRCRRLLAEGRPRLPSPVRGAGVDARRRRPDRQRRRQALAPARFGRHAHADPDRLGEAGSTSITPSLPTASRWPSPPGRSGRSPPRAASRRAITSTLGELGPRLVARRQEARLLVRPGAWARPLLDRPRRRFRAPAHDQLPCRRRPPVFARRPLDLLRLRPRRHPGHLADARRRRRPGRRQGRADHRRRSRGCRPPIPRPTASG